MQKNKLVYFIDIDGTICTNTNGKYQEAIPIKENINKINKLYDDGNEIVYWTARGTVTGIDWENVTKKQFNDWQVKYHKILFNKPFYDIFIDDKAFNAVEWFKNE